VSGGGLDDSALELPPTPTSRTTVTVMPPGLTVSVQPAHAPTPAARAPSGELALTVTVVLCPDASVPDAGDTVTCPSRLEDSEIDQLTVPNEAFRVSGLPFRPITIVVGETVRMPRAGGELAGAAEELADFDGAGEVVFALDAGAGLVGDGCEL
jgi:hypothetical protein